MPFENAYLRDQKNDKFCQINPYFLVVWFEAP